MIRRQRFSNSGGLNQTLKRQLRYKLRQQCTVLQNHEYAKIKGFTVSQLCSTSCSSSSSSNSSSSKIISFIFWIKIKKINSRTASRPHRRRSLLDGLSYEEVGVSCGFTGRIDQTTRVHAVITAHHSHQSQTDLFIGLLNPYPLRILQHAVSS